MVAMCFARSRRKEKIFVENVSNIIAVKFGFNRLILIFLEIDQSEKIIAVAAMFVNGSGRNEKIL
jgi:hypothetical protein